MHFQNIIFYFQKIKKRYDFMCEILYFWKTVKIPKNQLSNEHELNFIHSDWVHIVVKNAFFSTEMIWKEWIVPFVIFHAEWCEWFTIWVMGNDAALLHALFISIKSSICAWRHNSRLMNAASLTYACIIYTSHSLYLLPYSHLSRKSVKLINFSSWNN